MTDYKKVIIIGCSGSGKSTFARKLAELTSLPLYYLDMLYWKEDCTHISRADFIKKQEEIFKENEWIIDGNFRNTLELRIRECELIFFFDMPAEVCINGVLSRGKRPDMPCLLPADGELIDYIKNYNSDCKPLVLSFFLKYPDKKIITFHSHKDVDDYIQNFENDRLFRLFNGEKNK